MPSTVTNYSNNINVLYPIPGVDNDTQGFRDNFANIKNALGAAAVELDNLILNTSKLNTGTNDYSYGATIYRAPLKATGHIIGTIDNYQEVDTTVSFLSGGYHKFAIDGAVKLNVSDWPDNLYASVTFEVSNFSTGTSSITFDANGGNLKKESTLTLPLTLSTTTSTSYIFELWTADGGDNVFIKHKGTFE